MRATIGGLERTLPLDPLPFTIGRRSSHALSIPLPQVSRDHAQIVADGGGFVLLDQGSTHGTLLNGSRVTTRCQLAPGDTIEIPNCPGVRVIFDPPAENASLFLSQMQKLDDSTDANEFNRLRLLLDFGQRLHAAGGLDDILAAMLDAALRLTGAERGFVFLRPEDSGGEEEAPRLAIGRTAAGATLTDDRTISHSIVVRASRSAAPFIMTDSHKAGADLARSIVEQELRTVVAIPLREGVGVLYLDSHAASPALGKVSREMLDLLANDAAQVVLNARLARRQEEARLAARALEKELALAATIQQGLMSEALPNLSFARLDGLSQACLQIGGDFFDAVVTANGAEAVALVLADVSGKGAAAALLAASLQGLMHAELEAGMPLAGIATRANRFICQRLQGEKYATLVIVRLGADGGLEYVNCGHLPPLVVGAAGVRALEHGNMPVGLIPSAEFTAARARLEPGERLLLVTDGVTEAANPAQEMFGDSRLEACLQRGLAAADIAAEVRAFCAGAALADDLTLLEARFAPAGAAL